MTHWLRGDVHQPAVFWRAHSAGLAMGFLWIILGPGASLLPAAILNDEPFEEDRLEREVLVSDLHDAVQLQAGRNGDIYVIERHGAVKRLAAGDRQVKTLGTVPIHMTPEGALCGLALDRDFEKTRWIYLFFGPAAAPSTMRLSRFNIDGDVLDLLSEKILLQYAIDLITPHMGGGLHMDDAGDLWLGTGDNSTGSSLPPMDPRPGRELYDALRTAANSQDLRGKVLRIHPHPDGSYSIPAGNLFADPQQGRPEIFIMGCRNPIRVFYDSMDRALFWSEVGSNTAERLGTVGYEEINRSTKSGNSGWPLFIGPNAAYRKYDFVTGEIGASFDPRHPINRSPNNTGLHELPPPFPALIWYPSEDSPEFPELGSGGRAAMLGFVYHFDSNLPSTTKLPLHFDRHLFIYDWCRNWVKAVELDAAGKVVTIRPFLDRVQFHRPIDVKPGPDGALYLLEYGDKWHDNVDSTLSRVVYYRGNRPPRADMTVTSNAGKAPLHVKFAGANSIDPDGDTLSYQWRFGDDNATAEGRDAEWIYRRHGVYAAALKVADAHGLSATAHMEIAVGNSPPQVRIAEPAAGGFFEWGETFAYEFAVDDDEDGSTASATIHGDSVQARWEYREDPQATDPEIQEGNPNGGSSRMRRSTCLSCHSVATKSIGPGLLDVSARYRGDPDAAARLTQKILNGGHGTWGEIPMPPHPQHSADEIQVMVDYVLGLRRAGTAPAVPGIRGIFRTAPAPIGLGGGAYVLTASYTDRGADGVPALTGEARTILHALRKRAMLFDESRGARILEVATLERRRHVCVQLAADSYISFKSVNLRGVNAVHCQVSASTGHGGVLEIRIDSPDGPLVGEAEIPVTGRWDIWKKVQAPLRDPGGVHDLYVVARKVAGGENRRFNLDILEFQRGSTAMAR